MSRKSFPLRSDQLVSDGPSLANLQVSNITSHILPIMLTLPATIILLQSAPIGFNAVGWKYFLLVIVWSVLFIPAIYFFWPETARLSLEEIGKQFGDEVAVHINDATDEERAAIDRKLISEAHGDKAPENAVTGVPSSRSSQNVGTEK